MFKTCAKTCARRYRSSHPVRKQQTPPSKGNVRLFRRDKTSLSGRLRRFAKGVLKHRPREGLRHYCMQGTAMANHESRVIKGWRARLEEEAADLRKHVWQAPARTVYHEGQESCGYDNLLGHAPWFHREFGIERALAGAALKKFRAARAKIARSEWPEEKRQAIKERRARISDETREKYNATTRAWRARQPPEWRATQALKKRQRRAAKPDLYREIDRRSKVRQQARRDARRLEVEAAT